MTMAPNTPGVEGNNCITTWALTACLGNSQAVPDMEMCGTKRGRKGSAISPHASKAEFPQSILTILHGKTQQTCPGAFFLRQAEMIMLFDFTLSSV